MLELYLKYKFITEIIGLVFCIIFAIIILIIFIDLLKEGD